MSLSRSVLHGVAWSGGAQLLTQVFQFTIIAVLARLLSPRDFGLVGMASILTGLLITIGDLGLSAALIQRKEITHDHLSTVFWTSSGIAGGFVVLIWLIAPLVALFFSAPSLQNIVRVLSFSFPLIACGTVHRAILSRNLQFRDLALVDIAASVASGIVSLVMAFVGFGVWSLVAGALVRGAASTLAAWYYYPWFPVLAYSWQSLQDLLSFGANVVGVRFLNYWSSNIDYLIIGKVLGSMALGYYTIAYMLVTVPQTRLLPAITRVVFPAFSKIQNDHQRIQVGYLKLVSSISFVAFPALAGLAATGPLFVRAVYGENWVPAILPLQILCLAGAVYAIATTVGTLFLSQGRPDIEFRLTMIRIVALGSMILAGSRYGIVGVAIAVSAYAAIFPLFFQWIANRLIQLPMSDFLRALTPSAFGAVVMGTIVWLVQGRIGLEGFSMGDPLALGSLVALGIIVYLAVMALVARQQLQVWFTLLRTLAARPSSSTTS